MYLFQKRNILTDNDSFSFSSIIYQLSSCVDSLFMVSVDIDPLFIKIPLDAVISLSMDLFYRSPLTSIHSFLDSVFMEFTELANKSVTLSFNYTMYHQVDGDSMGSPLGPILANIFVGFYENVLSERFPKPKMYLRYVDNTFACFSSRNEALSVFHCLNDLYTSVTFILDGEKDNKLPFLDLLVELSSFGFVTCIYRKPSFTGLYLR